MSFSAKLLKNKIDLLSWAGLAALIIVLLALLLHSLGYLSLWMDEGFHYLAAKGILEHGYPLFPSGHVYFKAILYTYVLSFFSLIFGLNADTLRLVSLLAFLGLLPLVFVVVNRLFTKTLAWLSVVLLAFSAWEIEYARAALYFAPLQLTYLASVFLFYKAFLEERPEYRKWAFILFLITPLIHQLGVGVWFCFPALILIKGFKRFTKKDVVLFFSLTTVFFALIQVHEYFFWKVGYVYERSETSLLGLIRYFFSGFSFDYFKELSWSFPIMSLFVVGGLFLCLGILWSRAKEGEKPGQTFEFNWLFVNINLFFPLLFLGFFRTHIQPRYLFQIYPFFVILFLVCLDRISAIIIELAVRPFTTIRKAPVRSTTALLLCILLVIALVEGVGWTKVKSIINRQYGDRIATETIARSGRPAHEDHKGPGEYVRRYLRDDDLVIAIHVVFEYIYVGRVDYWLWTGGPGTWDAWEQTSEGWKDFYVGAKWIHTLTDLKAVIAANPTRRIWIITCPSIEKKEHIKPEIADFIRSQADKRVFRGKDDLSEVYLWHDLDRELTGPEHTFEAEWYPENQGKIVYDRGASKGSALALDKEKDREKPLVIKLNQPFPKGLYKLVLRVRSPIQKPSGKVLGIKILFKNKEEKSFEYKLTSDELAKNRKYQDLEFEFAVKKEDSLRIWLNLIGTTSLWLDYLDIIPIE